MNVAALRPVNVTPTHVGDRPALKDELAANSHNLDFLRSAAVLLVVGFHLAKYFNWQPGRLQVTDFGLLGVMLFFVHTTLVLMFSLERQRANSSVPLFMPFMMRRCFRIYPLAIFAVAFVYLFRIPSDLQFGRFDLLHQTAGNFAANLLLIQNVTRQKANPGPLWSLPLELQMYLVLPALFLFASYLKSAWGIIAFWWATVGLWFSAGLIFGLLPLSEGGIRSPVEALLKFTRFAPCFLPGIIAYKLWRRPRVLSGFLWPVFLLLCCGVFLLFSGSQPIEVGWLICFGIGLGVCLFRELPAGRLTRLAQIVARYSYGIYLFHYFAIWLGFSVARLLDFRLQVMIFVSTLVCVSAILYHIVEAPMIALGARASKRIKYPLLFTAWKTSALEFALRGGAHKVFANSDQK
jgi:peptidoglycan/LPS O-acetylase OafA/YrhL